MTKARHAVIRAFILTTSPRPPSLLRRFSTFGLGGIGKIVKIFLNETKRTSILDAPYLERCLRENGRTESLDSYKRRHVTQGVRIMTTLVRRPRTLAFDSMERRDLMAPLVVVGGGLINVDVRNVLNNLTVDVNVTDNTVNIIRNSVVIVDIL